ncbi:MAG TPA: hypothetical protein VGO34_04850 [Alphaproteobacteria bacterium]|jgi:tripartite-type tricarboxylate transporter receptor subunit TctC
MKKTVSSFPGAAIARRFAVPLLVAASVVAAEAVPAVAAESVADFYKGKNLILLIGNKAGGGNDIFGRPFMRYFTQHLPGHPTAVIQNMTGASGITAANYLYNVAPKDGTVLGMITSATLFLPLFGNQQTKFDPTKLTWVGNGDEIIGTCGVWHTSGIETFEDLQKKEVNFGGTAAGGVSVQHPIALRNLFGAKINLIKGYPGTNDVNLAMQRGEVAGACALSLASLKDRWWEDWQAGRVKPIIQLGINKSPDLPGVAHIYDYAKTDEDRQVLDLVFGRQQLGRPISAPPGLPADRTAALRAAFDKVMVDPGFTKDMAALKIDVTPSGGKEVEAMIKRFFSISPEVVARASKAVEE